MQGHHHALLTSLAFVLLSSMLPALRAQEFRATIAGQVTDASGATVAQATIIATKTDTNTKYQTITGMDGLYTLPFLQPGPYQITAEAPGFKLFSQSGIIVNANARITLNITLTVGATTESIVVTADAPMLDTESASTGQLITQRQVENLPLNGRNPFALARLAFGVNPTNPNVYQIRPFDVGGATANAMGGAKSGSNEILLNGVPDMGSTGRGLAYSPPLDAVDEVRVQIFEADASYGNTGGGTVNVTTKGGTNQFHGSAYEYNQTSALSATDFFINKAGQKRPVTRQNQYGGTLGGPLILPRLIDGRDKVFFHFAYEGFKASTPAPRTSSVPTAAMRKGDFSALLALGPNYQFYDPATGLMQGGVVVRQPFQGNVIPTHRLDPLGLKLMDYWPSPNLPGKQDGSNNFFFNGVQKDNYNSYLGRLDFNFTDDNRLFFEIHQSEFKQHKDDVLGNIASGVVLRRDNWGGVLDDVHMFSPTFILNTRLGVTRFAATTTANSIGFDPTSIGFPAYLAANATILAMPRINTEGFATLSVAEPYTSTPYMTWQVFANATKIAGRHTLKMGTDLRLNEMSSLVTANPIGAFNFNSNWLKATGSSPNIPFGGSIAALLLGLPSGGSYQINSFFTYRNNYYALFLQDDWHVRPNLTLNLGLRWERVTPTHERHNKQTAGFDANAINRVTEAARAAYAQNPLTLVPPMAGGFNPVGGLLYATGSKRAGYTTPNSFNPRFGISWSPKLLPRQTVFSAGLGMFQYTYPVLPGQTYGFSQATEFVPSIDNMVTPAATLRNPFPQRFLPVTGARLGIDTNLGQDVNIPWAALKNQYSLRWSFGIQQELAKNLVLDLGYVGNHSVRLNETLNLNALPPEYRRRAFYRDDAWSKILATSVPNPFAGLLPGTGMNAAKTTVASLLRRLPQYGGTANLQNIPMGGSYYYMASARLEKRFSAGLQFSLSYTWSRLMENWMPNAGDPTMVHSISGNDFPNRWVFSSGYDLPFGKGRRFAAGMHPVLEAILGGWMVNGVYTWQTGGLVGFGDIIYYGGPLNWDARNIDASFDVTRFERNSKLLPDGNHYRTAPRYYNDGRKDSVNNVDLAVNKSFRINERTTLQYRAEAFNAFNHVMFDAPNTSPTSAAFGVINRQQNPARTIQMSLRLKF